MADDTLEGEVPDPKRRAALIKATAAAGGLGVAAATYPFRASLAPSERAKALGAPVAVDIGRLPPGDLMTAQWRGNPVWILHRTPDMLASLKEVEPLLVDPGSARSSQQPEYARTKFDLAGRVFKDVQAPTQPRNPAVPLRRRNRSRDRRGSRMSPDRPAAASS